MTSQYDELLQHTSGWDLLVNLRHPCEFQWVSRLASLLHVTLVAGISQTLWRWTDGATYIRQRDHHVGHWTTFLVVSALYHKLCTKKEYLLDVSTGIV